LSNLFVGSLEESYDTSFLDEHQIDSIVNVDDEINISERVGRNYKKFAGIVDDDHNSDISTILPDAIRYIEREHADNRTILVHCLEGKSRSVCVVISYLVCVKKCPWTTALEIVYLARPQHDIYDLFLEQTKVFCEKIDK